jgi:hypothetical protein
MTPSQYVASEVGGKAETICALLSDIVALRAALAESERKVAALQANTTSTSTCDVANSSEGKSA